MDDLNTKPAPRNLSGRRVSAVQRRSTHAQESAWLRSPVMPQVKIGRPRQLYLGETLRDYVDIENR